MVRAPTIAQAPCGRKPYRGASWPRKGGRPSWWMAVENTASLHIRDGVGSQVVAIALTLRLHSLQPAKRRTGLVGPSVEFLDGLGIALKEAVQSALAHKQDGCGFAHRAHAGTKRAKLLQYFGEVFFKRLFGPGRNKTRPPSFLYPGVLHRPRPS